MEELINEILARYELIYEGPDDQEEDGGIDDEEDFEDIVGYVDVEW